MKLNELRQIIREEIKEVMDNPEMYVIYTQERDGKKRRMHTVPRNKAEITYNNVMRRYLCVLSQPHRIELQNMVCS